MLPQCVCLLTPMLTMSMGVSTTEKNGTDALSNEKGSWSSSDWSSVDED